MCTDSIKIWQQMTDFIQFRMPQFSLDVQGASSKQIALIESLHPHPLPSSYKSYLYTFGHSSGSFTLDDERYTSIPDLLNIIQSPEGDLSPCYPEQRYMWIGGQIDESDHSYWGDFYLDLQQGDPQDPPLMVNNFYYPLSQSDTPYILNNRFSQYVQKQAFRDFEPYMAFEQPYPYSLYSTSLTLGYSTHKINKGWHHLVQGLKNLGFVSAMVGGPELWIGRQENKASVCLYISTCNRIISLSLYSNSQSQSKYIIKTLTKNSQLPTPRYQKVKHS